MTWPAVFDGKGALTVDSSAFDPDGLVAKIPGLTWIAPKVGGTDDGGESAREHDVSRWRAGGLSVGMWVYCVDPGLDVGLVIDARLWTPDFVIYDVEQPYKSDEGGHYEYAALLVQLHTSIRLPPAAVTSYGAYKSSVDFASFASAGWPIFAQVYDSFKPGDELSYHPIYPTAGIHRLTRSLSLSEGEAVYRPESIDG